MQQKIITLLSDFGLKDPYVAEMKAVILSKCPGAIIVDISHEIDKFNIRIGAFTLASAAPYFPKGTVHVAVVDPSVGTKRHPIIIETGRYFFVGPDNGLLMLAASKEGVKYVYVIENPKHMLAKASKTFHGRDVFALAAAHLANGCAASEFGREINDYVMPDFVTPKVEKKKVVGEILYVDGFGNIVTNISSKVLGRVAIHENEVIMVELGEKTMDLIFCSAYGDVSVGEVLAIVGSHDFFEVSINQGDAAKRFRVKSGDAIHIWRYVQG